MANKTIQNQKIAFDRIATLVGRDVALYCMCAVYDVAFDPEAHAEDWDDYAAEYGSRSFGEGETDANTALLAGMPDGERWLTIWGDGYSESDYRQLDSLYHTMTAQLDSTGGLDPQQQDTARTCARMALNRNKLISNFRDKDSISTASTLDKMIRENLKDSNMRKADILPNAQQRPDGFVDALKKKYGLTVEMTKDDVMQAFFTWCRSKKYPETVDAEEHAMMAILRTMQRNDDMPEPTELPENMSLAAFEHQFASEPNEMEQDAYEYLHLVRGEFKKDEDD